ncbi:putative colanic acid biosynthesis acetyltransferase [Kocuria soli]|uniref:Putative colanic acid biosynthesis acetyltransferase n=1 Tax=Kocuria soli TaxID=2485125 RepID=A0A3N3ZQ85_9MICC|nr:putative colanic acid biosynthesis acetyltransferase [Kocuria soli]
MRRRLASFTGNGYDKGRSLPIQALWVAVGSPATRSILCPPKIRVKVLRAFGANIGENVLIRHRVHIQWPWKLTVGSNSWIGVESQLINLEDIIIGEDVCLSQQSMLCTGSHRADVESFDFDNAPVTIRDGAWIATRATVLRGVTVGENAVIGATALVTQDVVPDSRVLAPRAEVAAPSSTRGVRP